MIQDPVKLLLVGGDECSQLIGTLLKSRDQFTVNTFPTLEKATEEIGGRDFHLLLLEHEAEKNSQLIKQLATIRELNADLPIIILTDESHDLDEQEILNAGAQDYLIKTHLTGALLERAFKYSIKETKTLHALRASEERYALAAHGTNDGLWDWDLKNDEAFYSMRWKMMLGYAENEIANRPDEWFSRVHPDDYRELERELANHLESKSSHFQHEHRMLHRNGKYYWMLSRGVAVRDASGAAYRMVGSQTDINKRKQVEAKLQHDAVHDTLTGLPNRELFTERIRQALVRLQSGSSQKLAILFLDLDRFKMVNDSLGHSAGDGLLIEVAQRLKGCLRLTDLVARLSGDEFAVMLTQLRTVEDAALISARLQESLVEPFQVAGREVYTSASIGIVLRTGENETAEDLLRDADIALHRAKLNGKSRFELFDPQMHEQAKRLMQLETDLRLALQRNEFVVYYQPIINLKTGRLSGFESLIRWNHPERGIVGPVDFISISEENGLINPIGQWVLQESCRQLHEWQSDFPNCAALTISVNLSGKQLATPGLIEIIKAVLNESGINPTCLKLEITESVIMDNANVAADILGQLKALGVRLAIDDFGTGYSSFGHLHKFPIDTLKIDRSFVNQMELSSESAEIIKTILVMAHNLNKEVVAEGVENTLQIEQLRALGCDLGQGFFINHPMKAEAAVKLVAEENELQTKDSRPLSGYATR